MIKKKDQQKWEGISDNLLKITVSEFFFFDENISPENIKIQIKGRVDQRASLIIASYININLPRNKVSVETDKLMNELIVKIISGGKFIGYNCNENHYCTAYGEYNISILQKNLNKTISR